MRDVVTALGSLDPALLSANRANVGAVTGCAANGRPQ
jgi:hypothetical protein